MVRGLSGDFHHNLLLDLQSHNWSINPETGAKIHDNIFAPRYDGLIVNLVAGITMSDTNTSGVEIYNNTFHGGPGFIAPAIDVGAGVTLASLRSNLFYDFRSDWFWGNAIVRPDLFEELRLVITQESFLKITGKQQTRENVFVVQAQHIERLESHDLAASESYDIH